MDSRWTKYKHDPQIGPLLHRYHLASDQIEFLKRDLRDSENIEKIVNVSHRQVELKYRISRLVGEEEDKVLKQRMSLLWMALVFTGVLVGAANLLLTLIK